MNRSAVLVGTFGLFLLAGCGTSWTVAYDDSTSALGPTKWHVHDIVVTVPDELTETNANGFAPNADIVWHGERAGDRRNQVAAIVREGVSKGVRGLKGPRGVDLSITLRHFHAVTPRAVSQAPGAVHNISYVIQVFDDVSGEPITEPEVISADLEALVGSAAVVAAAFS